MNDLHKKVIVRTFGKIPYHTSWQAMQNFTIHRNENTMDELWCLEHPPVFTQGQAGKAEHILKITDIPIIQTDRGGQVTYHGPGQLIIYLLVDIRRKNLGIRTFVCKIEQAVIESLKNFGVQASVKCGAPGIYVNEAKICSLGLRIKKGASYHGLSFNIDMDLTPFQYIQPCGFKGLQMIQLKDFIESIEISKVQKNLISHLARLLGYSCIEEKSNSPFNPQHILGSVGNYSAETF